MNLNALYKLLDEHQFSVQDQRDLQLLNKKLEESNIVDEADEFFSKLVDYPGYQNQHTTSDISPDDNPNFLTINTPSGVKRVDPETLNIPIIDLDNEGKPMARQVYNKNYRTRMPKHMEMVANAAKAVPTFTGDIVTDVTLDKINPEFSDPHAERMHFKDNSEYSFNNNIELSGAINIEPITDWGTSCSACFTPSAHHTEEQFKQFNYESSLMNTDCISAVNMLQFNNRVERRHGNPENEKQQRINEYNKSHNRKKDKHYKSDKPVFNDQKTPINKYGDTFKSESNSNTVVTVLSFLGASVVAFAAYLVYNIV